MSVEYIFFDTEPRDRFVQFLSDQGLISQSREDVMEGFVVELPDDPDDDMLDTIEERYQTLMDEQMVQAESDPEWVKQRVAGVNITRLDGSTCTVRLPAKVARNLLEHFSSEEVHDIVTAIAHSLDSPINAPLCCKDEADLVKRRG